MMASYCLPLEVHMAKPNYQFEKRQRDLAKKKKKEEKLLKKQQNKAEDQPGEATSPAPEDPSTQP